MSTNPQDVGIPQWDLADRLAKAMRHQRVKVQEMADYLGVSRNTVGNYTSGRVTPDRRTLRLWAMRTGVQFEWLETGQTAGGGGDGLPVGVGRRPTLPKGAVRYLRWPPTAPGSALGAAAAVRTRQAA